MTSQTKRKHSEIIHKKDLFDLCYWGYLNEEERVDLIREWLNTNKDDDNRLKAAITYQGRYGNWTPLHIIVRKQPPLDIIQTIIKYAPEVLIMKNTNGRLPIHSACNHGASLVVIQALITASPDTIKVRDNRGWLPLHFACWNNDVSLDILNFLIGSYPEGVSHQDKLGRTPLDILKQEKYAAETDDNGMFPLHHVCKNGYSDHLICLLIQAYPNSIEIKDNHGRTPLDYYTSFQGRQLCDEIIEMLQPVDNRIGKIPIVSSAPASEAVRNAVAPPVAQIETQPWINENEVEIRNAEMNDIKAQLIADINEVRADIKQVQSDLWETKAQIVNINTEVSLIKSDGLETKAEIVILKTDVSEIKSDLLETKAEIVNIKTEVSEIKSMVGDIQRFLRGMVSG